MPLASLLASIMDVAKELLNSEGCSLLLSDKKTGDLIFDVVIGDKGDIIQGERIPKGQGIAGTVAMTMNPIIVDDAQNDPRWYHTIDQKYQFHTRNILCIPMLVMGEFVGVLEIVNTLNRDCYDEWDLELAKYIATQAAIAINNRFLYDDLSNRVEEITALYEVSQAISLSNPDEDVIDIICSSIARCMKVRRASIIFFDEEGDKLCIESAHGLPPSIKPGHEIEINKSISGQVFKSGDPMLVSDIRHELPKEYLSIGREYKTDSFLSVPIFFKNKAIGVLSLSDKINGNHFNSYDLRIITTLSSQISQVHNNLRSQQEAENQRRLTQEIDIAAEIQKKILRDIPRHFKNHLLASYNKPAKVVGGDFYDFYKLDENKYSILVADISGKGIPAALFMGSARNIVRAERRVDSSPPNLLRNANRYIYQDSESGMFVTLFYAIIDSHNNLITYGSAGHNDQLFVRRKNREIVKLNAQGKALGLMAEQSFEERVLLYEPGDMLVLYTDGVTESFDDNPADIEHGEDQLAQLILQYIEDEPANLIKHLKQIWLKSKDDEYLDDMTIIAIKF